MTQPAASCPCGREFCMFPLCERGAPQPDLAALERELLAYAATWEQRTAAGGAAPC